MHNEKTSKKLSFVESLYRDQDVISFALEIGCSEEQAHAVERYLRSVRRSDFLTNAVNLTLGVGFLILLHELFVDKTPGLFDWLF